MDRNISQDFLGVAKALIVHHQGAVDEKAASQLLELAKTLAEKQLVGDKNGIIFADLNLRTHAEIHNIHLSSDLYKAIGSLGRMSATTDMLETGKNWDAHLAFEASKNEISKLKPILWTEKLKSGLNTTKGKGVAIAAGAAVVVGGVILARHFMQKQQTEPTQAER